MNSAPFGAVLLPLPMIVLFPPVSTSPPEIELIELPLAVITHRAMRTCVTLIWAVMPTELPTMVVSLTATSVAEPTVTALMASSTIACLIPGAESYAAS